MNIKDTFLNLTKHTVPYQKEYEYLKDVFPFDIMKKDPSGNYYIKIGNSNTMFASHLDTVGGDVEINHVVEGNIIKSDKKTILGADDKAGVVVLLYMIEAGVPGLYTFFLGEEVGCKGSRSLSDWIEKNKNDDVYKNINKVISFDRKDIDSVITYQMNERCCSDEFADSLIKEFGNQGLKYKKDTGGVLTDSVHFTDLYAECTNISVGYWQQHTNNERQDIEFLEKLSKACTKVNWENLTIKRKPGEVERLSYSSSRRRSSNSRYYSGASDWNDWNDWEDSSYYGSYGSYGGYGSGRSSAGWSSTKKTNTYSSKSSSQYVTDFRGDTVPTKDTVWCEFDNVHCLKDEAIWVDLLGFYTTPDDSVKPKTNVNKTNNNDKLIDSSKEYFNIDDSKIISDGKNLKIGDKVIHPSFGKGTVKEISIDNKKSVIVFDINGAGSGQKQIFLSIAKMKKI